MFHFQERRNIGSSIGCFTKALVMILSVLQNVRIRTFYIIFRYRLSFLLLYDLTKVWQFKHSISDKKISFQQQLE